MACSPAFPESTQTSCGRLPPSVVWARRRQGSVFDFPRLSDPTNCLVPHHLTGTLRPSPSARLSGSCLSAYLALHYGGFTGSNIKASSPAQPPPFRSRRYAPRPAETGTEGRTPRLGKSWLTIPACFAGRVFRTMLRASHFATDSALRASRGSNAARSR